MAVDRRKKYGLSDREFAVEWTNAASLRAFTEKTGIPGPSASAWASKLRRRGVRLKEFPRTGPRKNIEVDEINALIEQASKSKGE